MDMTNLLIVWVIGAFLWGWIILVGLGNSRRRLSWMGWFIIVSWPISLPVIFAVTFVDVWREKVQRARMGFRDLP